MDLVNSVTQNSNNRNVTMENQPDGGSNDNGNNSNSNNNNNNHDNGNASGKSEVRSMAGGGPQSSGSLAEAKSAASGSQVPDYLKAIGMDPRKFWPKKYRFTREKPPGQHNPLTIAQRNFYESNGYIVFDDCVPKRLLEALRDDYKGASSSAGGSQPLVSEFLIDKLLTRNSRLLQYVKCFCDDQLMLMTHRLIDSFQATDSRQLIDDSQSPQPNHHQVNNNTNQLNQQQRQLLFRDWMYLPFRPIDKVCCAVTAIEPLEHVLLVVPGTHRVGQCSISSTLDNVSAAYDSSQEKNYQTREIFECSPERLSTLVEKSRRGFKYINLKPGQTLFYHPGLIHGFSNDLVNFRKSQLVSVAYYAAADCEYVDLRKSAPSLLADETQAQGQGLRPLVPISLAHFGPDKSPVDYTAWLDRPRLISGAATKASL